MRSLRTQILDLFALAQRREVHLKVGEKRRAEGGRKLTDIEHFLPAILGRSPLLSTIDFLHLEQGCFYEDLVVLADIVQQADLHAALRQSAEARAYIGLLELGPQEPGGANRSGLVVMDKGGMNLPVFELEAKLFQDVLESSAPKIFEYLRALMDPMDSILTDFADWRKVLRRNNLWIKAQELKTNLEDLSMLVSTLPDGPEKIAYMMNRVSRFKEGLYYAVREAAKIRAFAETYYHIGDLTKGEKQAHPQLAGHYEGILAASDNLFASLADFADGVRARPLQQHSYLDLFLRAQAHEVYLKFGVQRRQSGGGKNISDMEFFFPALAPYLPMLTTREIAFLHLEAGAPYRAIFDLIEAMTKDSLSEALAVLSEKEPPSAIDLHVYDKTTRDVVVRGLVVRDAEPQAAATARAWWCFDNVMHRFNHDIRGPLTSIMGFISLTLDSYPDLRQVGPRKDIHRLVREFSIEVSDLSEAISSYAGPAKGEEHPFSGLTRVKRWGTVVQELTEEIAALKSLLEYYFSIDSLVRDGAEREKVERFSALILTAAEVAYNVLLASRDYVAGTPLEHGQKISFKELSARFRKYLRPTEPLETSFEGGLSEKEGIYASGYYLAVVVENLANNMKQHGDSERPGIRLYISRRAEEVTVQVRNFGIIRSDMLEEIEIEDLDGNPFRVQRMFTRGASEKAEATEAAEAVEVGVGGETIREIVEFMQGRVCAFNDGEEAVIEITLKYSA